MVQQTALASKRRLDGLGRENAADEDCRVGLREGRGYAEIAGGRRGAGGRAAARHEGRVAARRRKNKSGIAHKPLKSPDLRK